VSESNNGRSQSEGTGTRQESGEQAPRLLPLVRFQLRRRRSVVPQIRYFLQTRQIMSHTISSQKFSSFSCFAHTFNCFFVPSGDKAGSLFVKSSKCHMKVLFSPSSFSHFRNPVLCIGFICYYIYISYNMMPLFSNYE